MENKIQGDFHKWLWNTYSKTRGLCYHIPNGGLRSAIEATQLKAMGVIAGLPDYVVAIPAGGFGALYIEFKAQGAINKGKLTPHEEKQLKRQEGLKRAGNAVYVCDSLESAQAVVLNYLKGTLWLTIN